MRTTTSKAALPRDGRRRSAFTTKTYAARSPVVWQHLFLSEKRMTNWSGGLAVFVAWAAGGKVTRKNGYAMGAASPAPRVPKTIPVGAHVGNSSPPA
jgi:hypothetical protein